MTNLSPTQDRVAVALEAERALSAEWMHRARVAEARNDVLYEMLADITELLAWPVRHRFDERREVVRRAMEVLRSEQAQRRARR